MRTFTRLVAGAALAAAATAMTVVPAIADPPKGVTPKATDIVGVGSNTIQALMNQFSVDHNKAFPKGAKLFTWDAVNPKTGLDENIATKKGCAKIVRPNGSGAGVSALILNSKVGKNFCIDFARSSSPRSSSNPPKAKGGVVFVALAKDAVTFAANKTTNVPKNLTTKQLAAIYNCTVTTWNQVGGKSHARINAQLPQTSSGTRKFFLAEIGVVNPGSCVDSSKGENENNFPEENEGTNSFLKGANVIYPYSVGAYIAAVFHSTGKGKNAVHHRQPRHDGAAQPQRHRADHRQGRCHHHQREVHPELHPHAVRRGPLGQHQGQHPGLPRADLRLGARQGKGLGLLEQDRPEGHHQLRLPDHPVLRAGS